MRFQTLSFALGLACLPLAGFPQTISHAQAELLSETSLLTPGQPVTLGLHFTMEKGWHIYWKNPGDAGLATSVSWKLPAGFKAGPIQWPIPQVISLPSVTDFGYENETLLMIPITVPQNLKPGEWFKFSAKVQWLVCNETCIPGQTDLEIKIPVASGHQPHGVNRLFAAARRRLPKPLPAAWKPAGTLDQKRIQLTFQTKKPLTKAFFFPLVPDQIDNTAPQNFQATGAGFTLSIKRSDQLLADVQRLDGLLVVEDQGKQTGYEATIPLSPSN